MTNVALLTGDLMVSSRVEGAAERVGAAVKSVATVNDIVTLCDQSPPRLVIVDLSTPSLDIAGLVEQTKTATETAPAILAFGPHVHESLLAAARRAGCDEVASRGQFFAQLDAILRRAAVDHDDPAGG